MGEVVTGQFLVSAGRSIAPTIGGKAPRRSGSIQLPTANGERVPLSRVADIQIVEGASTITREWGQRRIIITANDAGRDLGRFVAGGREEGKKTEVTLPPDRYYIAATAANSSNSNAHASDS